VESVFDSLQEKEFSLLHSIRTGSMAFPPAYPIVTEVYFSEDNGSRRRAMDVFPSRGKVKNYGAIPHTPHIFVVFN
jgi:hypothetical protein